MGNHCTMEARMRPRIPERRLATVADFATDAVLTETWSSHPYWASWVTKFDETDLIYYLPEVFELLILLTGKKLDYVPVWCGNQLLYAVGFYRGELPFGPFWHDDLNSKWNMLEVAWRASVPLHDVCKKSSMLRIVTDSTCGWKVFETAMITSLCIALLWGEWVICWISTWMITTWPSLE